MAPPSLLLERIRAEREKLRTKTAKKSTTKTSKQSTKKTLDSPNEWQVRTTHVAQASQPQESTQLELDLE